MWRHVLSHSIGALAILLHLAGLAAAAEKVTVPWQDNLNQAWETTQTSRRPLLVFFKTRDCVYCIEMMRHTYGDSGVASDIRHAFVPVSIDADRGAALAQKFGVRVYPTTVIVSPEAKILDRINGYMAPQEFKQRLAAATAQAKKQP